MGNLVIVNILLLMDNLVIWERFFLMDIVAMPVIGRTAPIFRVDKVRVNRVTQI